MCPDIISYSNLSAVVGVGNFDSMMIFGQKTGNGFAPFDNDDVVRVLEVFC